MGLVYMASDHGNGLGGVLPEEGGRQSRTCGEVPCIDCLDPRG